MPSHVEDQQRRNRASAIDALERAGEELEYAKGVWTSRLTGLAAADTVLARRRLDSLQNMLAAEILALSSLARTLERKAS